MTFTTGVNWRGSFSADTIARIDVLWLFRVLVPQSLPSLSEMPGPQQCSNHESDLVNGLLQRKVEVMRPLDDKGLVGRHDDIQTDRMSRFRMVASETIAFLKSVLAPDMPSHDKPVITRAPRVPDLDISGACGRSGMSGCLPSDQ